MTVVVELGITIFLSVPLLSPEEYMSNPIIPKNMSIKIPQTIAKFLIADL